MCRVAVAVFLASGCCSWTALCADIVFCRGMFEAAFCQMKTAKMQYVMSKKQHQGNSGALWYNNTIQRG